MEREVKETKSVLTTPRRLFVVDTNVLLHDPSSLYRFEEHCVLLPVGVIEELDHFSGRTGELADNARTVIRRLDELRNRGPLRLGVPLDQSNGILMVVTETTLASQIGAIFQNAGLQLSSAASGWTPANVREEGGENFEPLRSSSALELGHLATAAAAGDTAARQAFQGSQDVAVTSSMGVMQARAGLVSLSKGRILSLAYALAFDFGLVDHTFLVSKDISTRVKADALGIKCEDYLSDKVSGALFSGFRVCHLKSASTSDNAEVSNLKEVRERLLEAPLDPPIFDFIKRRRSDHARTARSSKPARSDRSRARSPQLQDNELFALPSPQGDEPFCIPPLENYELVASPPSDIGEMLKSPREIGEDVHHPLSESRSLEQATDDTSGSVDRLRDVVELGPYSKLLEDDELPLERLFPNEFVVILEPIDEVANLPTTPISEHQVRRSRKHTPSQLPHVDPTHESAVVLAQTISKQDREPRLRCLHPRLSRNSWNIQARSVEQAMANQLLFDPDVHLVTLTGQAGTGKTLLALAAALEHVFVHQKFDRILITRPIMPLGKDIGYLPGNKDEKMLPWMQPIFDNLGLLCVKRDKPHAGAPNYYDALARYAGAGYDVGNLSDNTADTGVTEGGRMSRALRKRQQRERMREYKKERDDPRRPQPESSAEALDSYSAAVNEAVSRTSYERALEKIQLEAITYVRGRSIDNSWIMVDEAQNLSPHEIKTILSRCGQGTKMVLTGDPAQIDNPFLDPTSNGLSYAIERLKQSRIHGHVTLGQSERSELAAIAANLL